MNKILFVLFLLCANLHANVSLAPLPMADSLETTKVFSSFAEYISKTLDEKVSLSHFTEYEKILEALDKNELDLAYLGPLPFVSIHLKDKNIIPLVGFYEKNGNKGYRCVLATSVLEEEKKLKGKKLGLTQPLSTCGYFMTHKLLQEFANISIEDMKYRYLQTHTKVAKSIVSGEIQYGGMKDSVANEYQNLGISVLKVSEMLPSFILVANKNKLTSEQIQKLKEILLKTPKKEFSKWGKKISYGMFEVKIDDFDFIIKELQDMKIPSKGNY